MNQILPPLQRDWIHAKDFSDDDTGITVRVNSCTMPLRNPNHIPVKQYSFEIIRVREDGKVARFFPIMYDVNDGEVSIDTFAIGRLASLIDRAESWVESELRERSRQIRIQQGRSE